MRNSIRLLAFGLLMAVPAGAARGVPQSPEGAVYDKLGRNRETYVRYFPANPDNLNPIIRRDVYSNFLTEHSYDALCHYDTENNYVLKPLLAERHPETSEDTHNMTTRTRTGT